MTWYMVSVYYKPCAGAFWQSFKVHRSLQPMQSPQGKGVAQVRAHVLLFSRLEARLYGVELCSSGTLMLR